MYHKWQSYDVWFMRYGAWQTEFFVILDRFLPFYPTNNPKNQHFQRMEKSPEDIILHMCTKNDNHMMYGSWDIERENFLSFWTIFCPFTSLATWKIKILKNEKNSWRYYHFTQVYHKWQSYDVWFLRYEAWRTEFFVILDCFLPFYFPNNPKNQNFEKLKKTLEILSFYTCVP